MENNKELSEKKQCDIHVVGKRFLTYIILLISLFTILPIKLLGLQKTEWYKYIYKKYLLKIEKFLT